MGLKIGLCGAGLFGSCFVPVFKRHPQVAEVYLADVVVDGLAVACPGMGTGTGEMPAAICAKQMRAAWDEVEGGDPFRPTGVNDALLQHFDLLRGE